MSDNARSSLDRQPSHNRGHDNIRPPCSSAEYAERSQEYGEIAENIIARANPGRTHVGVAAAINPQQRK
jgi:hypothetical protein